MNKNIRVRLPVSRTFTTITFPPPCTYCGRPVAEGTQPVVKEFPITIRHWERNPETGRMELREQRNETGSKVKGLIRLKIPYCTEHTPVPWAVRFIQALGMGLTVLVTLHYILYPLATWHFPNWLDALCFAVTAPFLLFYPLQFLFIVLPRSLLIRFSRRLRDFHHISGHWGLSAVIGFECGQPGFGPVLYPLILTFSNPESAHRFLQAHPQAEIVLQKRSTREWMRH